jgi:FdhD protein
MDATEIHNVSQWTKDTWCNYDQELVGEEPILIRVEGHPYSVVMRTPGDEIFHAAGFCLTEGLIEKKEDLVTIGYCNDIHDNAVDVSLHPKRVKQVGALLKKQGFISQTSCGICGKEMIDDIRKIVTPTTDQTKISADQVVQCIDKLGQFQDLFKKTHASHAAMLLDSQLEVLSMAEDVGRHNALDKAIGKALMHLKLSKAKIAVLSSRISYEMLQKAGRACIPIVIGISRPTALAVKLGRELNMTIVSVGKSSDLRVYCGKNRLES